MSAIPARPRLRSLELLPAGQGQELLFTLRDPEGYGEALLVPYGAAVLASLMDGRRTLAEIQAAFQKETHVAVALADLETIVRRLEEAHLLAGAKFDVYRQKLIDAYLNNPLRPATHAGGAYPAEPEALRTMLTDSFHVSGGPGPIRVHPRGDARELRGLVSPHIDPRRGAAAYAWAYKQVAEQCTADLFVVFGTSHNAMGQLFSVSRKDFDTPLGVVRTDGPFIDRLAEHLASSVAGRQVDLFADELAHRFEHSIEFQAVYLQYVLGPRREFRIVPILTDAFQAAGADDELPDTLPEVQAFLAAVQAAATGHPGRVCYISGADLAHVGPRFGDPWRMDRRRLDAQAADDRRLLESARRCDSAGLYRHVARQQNRSRICGLAPTYTLLQVIGRSRGELLKYDQAVEPDGSACVTFASLAYYAPGQAWEGEAPAEPPSDWLGRSLALPSIGNAGISD